MGTGVFSEDLDIIISTPLGDHNSRLNVKTSSAGSRSTYSEKTKEVRPDQL